MIKSKSIDKQGNSDVYARLVHWCGVKERTCSSLTNSVSISTIKNIKAGTSPCIDTVQNICNELNITLGDFFADDPSSQHITERDQKIISLTQNMSSDEFDKFIHMAELFFR